MRMLENKANELEKMIEWIHKDLKPKKRTILYTDIVGSTYIAGESTKYNEGLPNVLFMAFHHLILANVLLKCNGELGDKSGDGVVCFFDNARDAITAAFLFLIELENYNNILFRIIKDIKVKVRIGIHKGPYFCLPLGWELEIANNKTPKSHPKNSPLDIQDEMIGYHISLSQRLQSVAEAFQVYISDRVIMELNVDWVRQFGKIGKVGEVHIDNNSYVVIHEEEIKLKGIGNLYVPKVYRIETRTGFISKFYHSYYSERDPGEKLEDWKDRLKKEYGLTVKDNSEIKLKEVYHAI